MWRPLECCLYRLVAHFQEEHSLGETRLSRMPVRIEYDEEVSDEAWRSDWPAVPPPSVGQATTLTWKVIRSGIAPIDRKDILIKRRFWSVRTVTREGTAFQVEDHTLADGPEKTFGYCSTKGTNPSRLCCNWRKNHKVTAALQYACGGFQRVTLGHSSRRQR